MGQFTLYDRKAVAEILMEFWKNTFAINPAKSLLMAGLHGNGDIESFLQARRKHLPVISNSAWLHDENKIHEGNFHLGNSILCRLKATAKAKEEAALPQHSD